MLPKIRKGGYKKMQSENLDKGKIVDDYLDLLISDFNYRDPPIETYRQDLDFMETNLYYSYLHDFISEQHLYDSLEKVGLLEVKKLGLEF